MWRKRVLRYLKKPSVCGLGSMRSASAVTLSRLARGGFFFFLLLLLLLFPLVLLVLSGLVFYFTL